MNNIVQNTLEGQGDVFYQWSHNKYMIEYTDKNLGKIKVLNVTEARANFASVLGDADSHYIITKNNKPLRVIVNYKDYEFLQEVSGGEVAPKLQKASDTSLDHQPPQTVQAKKKATRPSKNRVPGMLKTSIEQTKSKSKKTPAPAPKDPGFTRPKRTAKASKPVSAPEETLEALNDLIQRENVSAPVLKPQDDDNYFMSDDLSADDFIDDNDLDEFEILEDEDSGSDVDSLDVLGDEFSAEEQEEADLIPEEEPANPEEEEYFKKYKKLYSGMGGSAETQEDNIEQALLAKYDQMFGDAANKEISTPEVVANPITTEAPMPAPMPAPAPISYSEPEPKVEGHYFEESDDLADDTDNEESQDGLPSLKDLLKDLEDEQLSGEEDAGDDLNENDIDDLIERITQD